MSTGQNDFPDSILEERGHRPYPMPDGPWIMTQTWHDLLFAHWPIDALDLRTKVPPSLELDLFDGQAYVGVIPFHMTNVAPRGVPALPWVPYYSADMRVEQGKDILIKCSSRRTTTDAPSAEFLARYGPVDEAKPARRGSLEYFLTERYCLYTVDSRSRAYRVEIHRPAWPLQAAKAEITVNTMADAAGIRLPSSAPLLHFSRRQDMVNWALTRVR